MSKLPSHSDEAAACVARGGGQAESLFLQLANSILSFHVWKSDREQVNMTVSKETAAETLSLLEERLQRVDYVLNGNTNGDAEDSTATAAKPSATARLRALERTLQAIAAKSTTVSDILFLQHKHPELFHTSPLSDVRDTLPPSSLPALVLAHSQLYHSVSARLPQVQDASMPDPSVAAKLIELRPHIEQLQSKQDAQATEFAKLRTRSAQAVEAWYEGGVLNMGERWAEWEERLRDAEIVVRRREAAKKREEGTL